MNVEMQFMKDNEVWVLVELPPNGKTVSSKWLFKKKTDMDGNVHIYKAHLVTKGFIQTPGIDYEETFSTFADIRAIRILIAIAAYYDYKIWQMDVKTAFLNGYLNEEEKLKLSKSQGASTHAEMKRMQNVPYASAVGFIMYAVRCTRPDVANTKDMFLVYGGDLKRELRVSCYTDAGYLTDADDLKSQTGYVFVLNGGDEAVWVRKFISGLSVVPTIEEPLSMYYDNTGAIAIANESGITKGDNLADPFTKELAFPKHSEHTKNIGMLPASSLIDRSQQLIGLCQSAYIEKILKRYYMKNSKRESIPMQEKLKLSTLQGASTPAELKRMQNVPYASTVGSIMYAVRCTRPDVAFA
nr:putative retrotransposon protein [Tanacetum cinerariifolium]